MALRGKTVSLRELPQEAKDDAALGMLYLGDTGFLGVSKCSRGGISVDLGVPSHTTECETAHCLTSRRSLLHGVIACSHF